MKFKTIKRIKDIAERVIVYTGLVVFLNYFMPPLAYRIHSNSLSKDANDRRIQQVCRTDSHLEDIAAGIDTKHCGPLPLVKSAHALAAKWLSPEEDPPKESETALREGKADCSYYSCFTYSNFLYLADRFGRAELKNRVRLCVGDVGDVGHAWLQVNVDGKWQDYETTFDPLSKESSINFRHINNHFPNPVVLTDRDYQPFSHAQFKDGKLVNTTDFLGAFRYDKGLWW